MRDGPDGHRTHEDVAAVVVAPRDGGDPKVLEVSASEPLRDELAQIPPRAAIGRCRADRCDYLC